jgi:WD40-like Beta Propeller Repeat
MVAGRVRAAGAMLAGGLFLMAGGCSGSTATAPRAAPPATAAPVTVMTSTPATSGVTAAGFPADFIGVSWATTPVMAVVAVYSAADGHLIRTLTVPMPGGGPGDPRLSPDGRTVIFSRGQGSCAQTIDTVPFRGGREQVLIPMTGTGNNGILPGDPSYSADGRYLIYDTVPCDPSGHALLHIRDLGTGRELTGAGFLGVAGSVFLDHDSEVVFAGPGLEAGTGLEVLRMPSMAVTAYPVPRGCRYQALAGTGTGLDALLQCGPGHELSVVAISPRTFTATRTLIRLGSCGRRDDQPGPGRPVGDARGNLRRVPLAGRARRLPHREDPRRPGVARDVRPGCAAVGLLVTIRPAGAEAGALILLTRLVPASPGRLAYSSRLVPGSSLATGASLGAAATDIILVIRASPASFMIASCIAEPRAGATTRSR